MERCPKCTSEDAVNIVINLAEEEAVQFFQCRTCETAWWTKDGENLAIDDVLDLTMRDERK